MIKTNSLITFAFAITIIAMVIGILGTMVHPTFASQMHTAEDSEMPLEIIMD